MRTSKYWFVGCLLLVSATIHAESAKQVAGWVEPALLLPERINFMAKLDTGAENSSLNSQDISIVEDQGIEYVRFVVNSREGQQHSLQLPLLRYGKIKRHFGKSQERPVVMMEICLGDMRQTVPVNLVDRSGFNYQLLLGRSFLAPKLLVDSEIMETTLPQCQ